MPKLPRPEKEYFGKSDFIKLKKIAELKRDRLALDEQERLKKLHWHRCAGCGMELESIPFKGVMIYKCFNCNGVFLEEEILEKLCGKESHAIEALLDIFKF